MTAVKAGNIGASALMEKELADLVLVDIIESMAQGRLSGGCPGSDHAVFERKAQDPSGGG